MISTLGPWRGILIAKGLFLLTPAAFSAAAFSARSHCLLMTGARSIRAQSNDLTRSSRLLDVQAGVSPSVHGCCALVPGPVLPSPIAEPDEEALWNGEVSWVDVGGGEGSGASIWSLALERERRESE